MKRFTWYLIAAAAVTALATPGRLTAQEAPAVRELEVAGIPVLIKPNDASDVIAVRLYRRGGSATLTPATAGVDRVVGALLTRGTEEYSRDAFAARAAATGTQIGSETAYDFSVVRLQAVAPHWDAAWDLFTQAVLHPTFPEAEVALVRDQIVNDLRRRQDDPDAWLNVMADSLFYFGHAYAVDPTGTVDAVTGLTRDALVARHAERMVKSNLLFVVVGNVDADDVEDRIEEAFGDLPAGGPPAGPVTAVTVSPAELVVTERAMPTNYILGRFAAPDPGHPDYAAMRVGIDILSDRLWEEVRTKRNLTYAVWAALADRQANYGLLYVTAVDPAATIPVMLAEVERLKTEPISAERLAENINTFLTSYWLGQETNMGQATALGTFELLGGGWENADAFVERVQA